MSLPAAAWYSDPHDPTGIRWWDGNQWSEHVREHPETATATPAAEASAAPVAPEAVAPSVVAPEPSPLTAPMPVRPVAEPLASGAPSAFEAAPRNAPTETPRPFAGLPPITPAADPHTPAGPSALDPRASVSPGAPLEPPRTIAPETPSFAEPSGSTGSLPPLEPARGLGVEPAPALEPPRPFTTPQVIPYDPSRSMTASGMVPADTAPSIGAARLPKLESALPPPPLPPGTQSVSITPHTPARRVRLALGTLLLVVLAAGVGVLAMGQLGSLTGDEARAPSSTDREIYEGAGYSFELPKSWVEVEGAEFTEEGAVKVGFVEPNGSVLMVLDEPATGPEPDLDNPAERQALVARVLNSSDDGTAIEAVSQEATEIDGAPAVHLVFRATGVTGAFEGNLYLVVGDGTALGLMLVTPGSAPDATLAAQLQQIITSVRFD